MASQAHLSNHYFFDPSDQSAPVRPPHTGISWTTAAALVAGALLVAGIAVLNLVHVDKVIYNPGPVHDTLGAPNGAPVVQVEGLETYPTSGTLDFTTITLTGGPNEPITAWQWLTAEIDPRTTVVDQDLVFPPDTTQQQVQAQNAELMQQSQEGAAVVALRAIGEEVPEQIKVAQIIVGAPASGVLEVDDEIVKVDGLAMPTPDAIRDQLQTHEGGEAVDFEVVRAGKTLELQVPTRTDEVAVGDATEPRTVIGVYLASDFDLPYEVTIDAGNVGGPSAGLMFSLAVYDKITPGQLTGGLEFAGTGTIGSDGRVGPIGGIQQKMIGAQEAGADYFLAPADNCDEVVGHVPDDLTVARVATFEEAKAVVEQIAAGRTDGLPTCTTP